MDCNESIDLLNVDKFWVVGLPKELFSNDRNMLQSRVEFEALFQELDQNVQFQYINGLSRVLVCCNTKEQATLAANRITSEVFLGTNIRVLPVQPVTIGSTRLEIPARPKQFLVSPPPSPPVGWVSSEEQPPTPIDYNLLAALATLRLKGEQTELHPATHCTPSIVVTNDDDDQESDANHFSMERMSAVRLSSLPSALTHTSYPRQ